MAAASGPTTSGATVPTPPVFATAKATTNAGAAETVAAQRALQTGVSQAPDTSGGTTVAGPVR